MATQVLIGSPNNLFVFDFGSSGTGSAPFNGDKEEIQEKWDLVQHNVYISGSRGSLYRKPSLEPEITILGTN